MREFLSNAFVFGALLLLVACGTVSLESQNKAQDQRQARIYFLRDSAFLGMANAPYVKVNGQEVGHLGDNSSFFVDRDPGTYSIALEVPLSPGRFVVSVKVQAGATYYMKVSPRVESFVVGLASGMVGQIIEASVSENFGGYSLVPMDDKSGVALLQQLKS
jgi:Protein of unknown function (DUF2846)